MSIAVQLQDEEVVFRVLAWQRRSVELEDPAAFKLTAQGVECAVLIRPEHSDAGDQLNHGGALLSIEFGFPNIDLMEAANVGIELLEDVLCALSLVDGVDFQPIQLRYAERLEEDGTRDFLQFLDLSANHWQKKVSKKSLGQASKLVAHWDGLEKGHRLRRAARLYGRAIGEADALTAFQSAYTGLETLETVLAPRFGLKPGSEEVTGECSACKHTYTFNKTALVGVRAFILDGEALSSADPQRISEWKGFNRLRNDATHGLEEIADLLERGVKWLPGAMHHLHMAMCHESHAVELISEKYRMPRGPRIYAMAGNYRRTSEAESIENWNPVFEVRPAKWVEHDQYGRVPEFSFKPRADAKELRCAELQLEGDIRNATMSSFKKAAVERVEPVEEPSN